ncbi:MAG: TrbI/VirB10 family protein [Acidobacteriota bacterium]|nr:TrbI/VirB10 family protein [Acidobacteriota bacterium]
MDTGLPTPPSLPPVRRLNRAVLLAAALIVLITLCVAAFVVGPRAAQRVPTLPAPPLAGGDPLFLRQPPRPHLPSPPRAPADDPYLESLLERQAQAGPPGSSLPGEAGGPSAPSSPPSSPQPSQLSQPSQPPRDPRREAFVRALHAPLASTSVSLPPSSAEEREVPFHLPKDLHVSSPLDLRLPANAFGLSSASGAGGSERSVDPPAPAAASARTPETSRLDRLAALVEAGPPRDTAGRFHPQPAGPTLPAGSVLPALLLTEVNTGLPGSIEAQVSRDVYDERQEQILVPKGTRLLGRYDDQVAVGQRRLLVAWTRLVFPEGGSLDLPGLPATDLTGSSGLSAKVDNHLLRVFGDAVLLSLVGAGAQLSQPRQQGFAAAPSTREIAAGALGQELSSVALELIRRDLRVQPTLRLLAGTAFNVYVTANLSLPRRPSRD